MMDNKKALLEKIKRLSEELREAKNEFSSLYGDAEIESKVIKFLSKREATLGEISRNVRSFARLTSSGKSKLLDDMVKKGELKLEVMPTFSGRGRPRHAYFLVEEDNDQA